MAYDLQTGGSIALRKELVDSIVKQVGMKTYKFKQAVAIVDSNSWKNTFFREDPNGMADVSGNDTEGLPRGANFPQGKIGWEEISVKIVKFGMEKNIPWEDILSSEINVQARTIIRVTENVVKAVDDYIFRKLSDDFFGTTLVGFNKEDLAVQSYAVTTSVGGNPVGSWDESSGAIIDSIQAASQKIADYNYDTNDLMLFVSPRDKRSIMKWLYDKGAQWMPIAADLAQNGNLGKIAGVNVVETSSVTASFAILVKPKVCATFKQLVPLQSTTIDDPMKSLTIRVTEEGCLELTDPKAIVILKDTQGS